MSCFCTRKLVLFGNKLLGLILLFLCERTGVCATTLELLNGTRRGGLVYTATAGGRSTNPIGHGYPLIAGEEAAAAAATLFWWPACPPVSFLSQAGPPGSPSKHQKQSAQGGWLSPEVDH